VRQEVPTRLEALAQLIGLREENQRLREKVARLEAENGPLKQELWELKQRFAALEARLNQNSGNSSKPPSSDPPSVKLPPKKKPSGRKPGGQPGHKGSQRELLPAEKVNKVEDHYPGQCEHCKALHRRSDKGGVGGVISTGSPTKKLELSHGA
jgi:transposase